MPTLNESQRLKSVVERIKKADIREENKELIWDYKKDLEVNDYSNSRIYKLLSYLKIFGEKIDYSFEDANLDDIKDLVAWINKRDLAEATKRDYKVILKQFYKWLNDGSYPDKVDWINTNRKNSNKTLPKDVLTEEDIQKLLDSANNTRDKALISMLWETGARIGELIDLKISDLKDHAHGKKIVIEGKTGARRLPLISSVPHIQAWLNNHPRADESDAPLWVNLPTANNNPSKKMEYRTITKQLNKTKERTDLEKPVNPHHFRHSRATYLASKFTESQLCEWFGWVQGSNRPADYVHMSGRDIDGDYARLHGREDEKESKKSDLAPVDCPRCGEKNNPEASFCQNCGQSLEMDAQERLEKEKQLANQSTRLISKEQIKEMIREINEEEIEE